MTSIAVWSRKGGVGKTTVALHLVWFFARLRGFKVLAIDLDIQGNLTRALGSSPIRGLSSQLFEADFQPPAAEGTAIEGPGQIHLVASDPAIRGIESRRAAEAVIAFRGAWARLVPDYDVIVVDCPPSEHVTVVAALMTVQFGLAPIDVGQWSVDGIEPMLRTYLGIQKSFNPSLRLVGMLACRVDNRVALGREVLGQLARVYGQFLLPVKLSHRHAFAAVATHARPVWELRGAADAASEMLAVCRHVQAKVLPDVPA